MTDDQQHHKHKFSQSTAYSDHGDSAATTLLASANNSFDEGRKYADIELKRFDERERRSNKDEVEDNYDCSGSAYDSDHGGRREDERGALLSLPSLSRSHSHTSTIADDFEPPPPPTNEKEKPVSWSELPKKGQLTILTLARLSEPLTQTSLQSYMFYQLKSFKLPDGSSPSDGTVATQAGILAAAFTGAQFLTAMLWGRAADSEYFGRKRVILIGLLGTAIGSLGFGFSESFPAAVFWRCAGGMLNGNIGVMRTMISEIIREKKFQSRAFLLLPMTFNIGVIIGPLIGGLLADPIGSYPGVFAGVWWLERWPYALPNVVNATFLIISAVALVFGLEETLEGLRDRPDYGVRFSRWVGRAVFGRRSKQAYVPVAEQVGVGEDDVEAMASNGKEQRPTVRRKLPVRRIWTRNVLFTLLSHGLLAMHVESSPNRLPRSAETSASSHSTSLQTVPKNYHPHPPFVFTGGLALPPPSIGTALAILGVIGITLQLLLYPRLSFYLGTAKSLRLSVLLFPISYFITPYLSTIPSSTPPPAQASGFGVWAGITTVLCIQVLARTFALPATAILVNNSCPHPSVLGLVHGIAQSVSSAARTVGPVAAGALYSLGLSTGVVGLAWWCMAGIAVLGAIAGRWVEDGSGHSVFLEGEREEEGKG
ncbi:hypothetical protein LTR37_005790 [Vermiconidia calcicola]|uniref:Uncharacterized protein n=1 Tax=Vermiconidia calcicola TaxID=1690605 RepID=A0ACC3NI07_9PEZI|nr:hypothetical protein LTR37_005790 [Vermiconidia calcicola]